MKCRRILRMSVAAPRCIDWGVLADGGQAERARAILGEDTPWTRLFDIAAAVREQEDDERPPDIEFSLRGQHMEMSIERFAVHLGIYYEPDTVRDAFTQGLTQGENGVMRACIVKKASVVAILALSAAAAVSAQATAPAPSPDAGAGFSVPASGVLIGSSMLVSLFAFLRN
ncbi:hypothetical protein E3N88_46154 [Mikania micrantha]|uniref:Uncharacterized protein n=1 Tax=Mikania micrantha TaxID=192012 RepID=A0A5N6L786_9ASTR|nr:hypothetical protein E3N88_46154 [Mikania micrantha]